MAETTAMLTSEMRRMTINTSIREKPFWNFKFLGNAVRGEKWETRFERWEVRLFPLLISHFDLLYEILLERGISFILTAVLGDVVEWADDGSRTHDLFLTKETLYHWATSARVLGAGFEPAEPFRATVLQTVAIDHSAIPARRNKARLFLLFKLLRNLIWI